MSSLDNHLYDLQELIKELNIKVTDETKPTELFEAITKLLAAYAAAQPSNDEIADYTMRKIKRDTDNLMRSRGL